MLGRASDANKKKKKKKKNKFDFSGSAEKEYLLFLDDTSTSQQKRKDDRRKKESLRVESESKVIEEELDMAELEEDHRRTEMPTTSIVANHRSSIPFRSVGSFSIPAIITGMWQVAGGHGKIDQKKAVEEMKQYAFAGLGVFDLADIYGPSEEIYGKFLREHLGANLVLGFTKFVPRYGRSGTNTREVVESSIDRSRKHMGVSTLDMVQFHWWDYRDVHYFDSMKLLYTLKREGKMKELGLTNFDTLHMAKLYEECAIPIVSNQVAYSIIDRRPEKKMVAWCLKHNVKILGYGSLLGGFLSEKYLGRPEPQRFELTTRSLSKYKHTIGQWDGWMLFQELLLVLSQIADKYKVSISNAAVRYIADKPAVAAVIIGARLSIAEHITRTQAMFSFPGLDQGDVALIHAVVEKGNGIAGDCGDEYH